MIASFGIKVTLYDMKPSSFTPAHKSADFCELVCSNSFRSDNLQNAAGLLKQEMRELGSIIMEAADRHSVPAGGSLAVNRADFARLVTEKILSNPNIEFVSQKIEKLPTPSESMPVIVATGPLTDGELLKSIEQAMGESLHFFDAAAPIVSAESLNFSKVFEGSRYDKGNDYINCPMDAEEYFNFVRELVNAEPIVLKEFESGDIFEGCMPVEVMAKRGEMTLAYGPLKPVGLTNPHNSKKPFAVVQLRKEDKNGKYYNIVGFQTNLKFSEQKRVFSMIPGLENAEFMRYGVMHRNSFINSPNKLDFSYMVKNIPNLYFAGQITGVEGYLESASSGLLAGLNVALALLGHERIDFTKKTAIGALAHYVSAYCGHDFQPQNINFGLIDDLDERIKNKQDRNLAISSRSLEIIRNIKDKCINLAHTFEHSMNFTPSR
ncbi:MAG: methylenetetrahydrofolate--tRNA-(uracil(54)-C(5))-methyltransferase (FADH(2)-oxidizing) TrmFO [Clostridiales bacterium]|nr:methylenetetrahydrofolate--tRNA-(uracil(54)-C(5))-methyltransferase (FADH(2)-oxidizing) TrmFO [Clostridiales bacterium]